MSLPINPLAKLVASVSDQVSAAANEAAGAAQAGATALSKMNLDQTISRVSGGIGSGLNGITAGLGSAAGSLQTALGGIGNSVQSSLPSGIGNAISGLQSSVGSISNITADISGSLNKLGGGNIAGGIMQAAGAISKAAGALNNLLSLKRGGNLPSGAQLFSQTGKVIRLQAGNKNDWRVRLNAEWSIFNSPLFSLLENTGGMVFPYMPNITVSTKANYSSIETIHSNYPMTAYKNSSVDEISISGEFSQETETDAAYWIAATTFLKTATKMFYGQGPNAGNPPIICNLSGYGGSVFNNVPVIVKSFSVDLKEDVNYINCNTFGTNTWVPVISTITVVVQPIYNRERLRKFSLEDYARGKITGNQIGFL